MAGKPKLAGVVLAYGPDGPVMLTPQDELPKWALTSITNPSAWEDGEIPSSAAPRKSTESN